MWTITAVVLTLLGGMAVGLPEMPSVGDLIDAVGERPFRSLRDLNDYTDSLLDLANHHMAKSFAAETRRYKRALDLTSIKVSGTAGYGTGYSFAMDDLSKFNSTNLVGVTKLTVHNAQNSAYWIMTYDGHHRSHAIVEVDKALSMLKLIAEFQLTEEFSVLGKCAAHVHNGILWVVLTALNNQYVRTLRADLHKSTVEMPQTFEANGLVGGLHMFEDRGSLYMVTGIAGRASGKECEPETSLYKLIGNHFDKQHEVSFTCRNVTSVTGFRKGREYFLIFGMSKAGGSHVYRFTDFHNMYLSQILDETDVTSSAYFYEQQEGKHNILVNNGAETVLYRWEGLSFIRWQRLETQNTVPPITSVASYTFPSLETIIMTARGDSVSFYTDDVFGYFKLSFVMQTHCHSIHNLLMKKLSNTYVIVYICVENQSSRLDSREVIMDEVALDKPKDREDLLLDCLLDLKKDLNARKPTISRLEQAIAEDIVMTNDVSQTWLQTQTFAAGLTVDATTNILQTVTVKGQGTAQQHAETYEEFYSKTEDVEVLIDDLGVSLDDVLYHSTNQVLLGSIGASDVTADKLESNSTKITKLNEMPLLDMSSTFMIDGIDQNIMSTMHIHSMTTDGFSTRELTSSATINNVHTNQFLRKSLASQEVTGNHYYKNININNVHGKQGDGSPLVVNGIDTSKIVTKGNNFTFVDKKTFNSMTVLEDLDVQLLNEVDLSDLSSHLVYTNVYSPQILDGHFSLHDVDVDGNVDVKNINGVDMKQLNTMVVRTTGDFTLSGDVNYQNNFEVAGNMLSPKLNGIVMDNIVDKDTININGNYKFTNANVKSAIHCTNINGINPSVDVVTIDADQTILGGLTFTDDVLVIGTGGVRMLDSVKINNIDPYSLDKLDDNGNLLVEGDVTFNAALHVAEDVNVEVINGLALKGIEDRYWRKSTDQVVDVSPNIVETTFRAAVTARNINSHQMEDFLSVTGPQTISGAYTFQGLVTVDGNLKVTDGKVIDGVDVSSLKENLVTLSDNQDIETQTNFGKLIISGDLMLGGNLNGWNVVTDFVRLDQSLHHTGSLTFSDKTTAQALQLSSANIMVHSLNGLNVEAAKADLVIVNEDASIAGPLKFTSSITATNLEVGGTVDGVDIVDLVDRSLKKNSATPQTVTGSITVNKGVNLDLSPSLDTVNGKHWSTHLSKVVPQNYNGVIRGRKTFTKPVSISGNFNPTTINGFDVAQLSDRILTKSTNQNVASKYTIDGDVMATNVVAAQIDGVLASNLLLLDETSIVSGTVDFADNLLVADVTSDSGILDGCNLLQLNASTIWRDGNGDVVIPYNMGVKNLLVKGDVIANAAVKAGTGQMDIFHFLDTIVTKSSNQDISGTVEFVTKVSVTDLQATTIDGVDVNILYDDTVMDNEDSVIDCNTDFTRLLMVGNAKVKTSLHGSGAQGVLINNMNVTDVDVHAVHLTGGPYLITGDKIFNSGLNVEKLNIDGSLDGVVVNNLVVLSKYDRRADELVFKAPISIRGDLKVDGLLDNVNLEQLLSDRIKLDTTEALSSSTTFEGMKVEGDLLVEVINGIKLSDIVFKSGRVQQDIEGVKTFSGGLHVVGEMEAPVVNGVNILDLNNNVVRKDRAATISKELVFNKETTSQVDVLVQGNVNGYDLSETDYGASILQGNIKAENDRLTSLNLTLSTTHVDTKLLSCGMYETYNYGDKINEEAILVSGKMTSGTFGATPYVAVRECGNYECQCPSQYAFYEFDDSGSLTRRETDVNAAFLFNSKGYEGTRLLSSCANGGSSTLKILLNNKETSLPQGSTLGNIADAKSFSTKDGTYIVTAGATYDTNTAATTKISVLKLNNNAVTIVWSLDTYYSASTVDLTLGNKGWLLLVANLMASNDTVDPFMAPSQLFLWSAAEEKFNLIQEVMGQHVTSGIFLNSKSTLNERFFVLTQYMAAKSALEKTKFCTKVQVFKFMDSEYVPYESLPTFGAVAQTSLSIGEDLYLAVLSDLTNTLDIYEVLPSEGFHLQQKIPVCNNPLDVKKIDTKEDLLLISCTNPSRMMTIRLNAKGYSYRE
uniref:Polephole-like protein n=1 Tax=Penaeus vannamei TaxID=6689 RepID=A0A1I9UVP1_PENVA|nr:polephole-like protein [Penaeus vannamei]